MNGGAWMCNPKGQEPLETNYDDDDDSWEVKAFEQDTKGNIYGATWPPRSYTCNFCRREFRSAQGLGGHMNVHRRDRASKAHQEYPIAAVAAARNGGATLPNACVPPIREGLSCFYRFQNPSGIFGNSCDMVMNVYGNTTSFHSRNVVGPVLDYSRGDDEIDLELRLGHKPP
ncbi:unnamed protein product [Cochlearia groenlandica]